MFPLPPAGPEPPVRLERIEETTNKISLALEVPEDVGTKPGRFLLSGGGGVREQRPHLIGLS